MTSMAVWKLGFSYSPPSYHLSSLLFISFPSTTSLLLVESFLLLDLMETSGPAGVRGRLKILKLIVISSRSQIKERLCLVKSLKIFLSIDLGLRTGCKERNTNFRTDRSPGAVSASQGRPLTHSAKYPEVERTEVWRSGTCEKRRRGLYIPEVRDGQINESGSRCVPVSVCRAVSSSGQKRHFPRRHSPRALRQQRPTSRASNRG